ncbi:MAG: RNA polymerase sigma factor [Candidatus Eremiobacteraeota bacterium]|nr:RNA polymerase sigma factor [Candidatus Eremiobacteraeota bacterium]
MPTELVEAARTGGRDEVELLLRTIWPDAYRLARAIVGEDQPAEDAAQEACIVVYRSIASLRSSAAFRTWFYRIVVREAAELKRRRSRTEPAPDAAVSAVDQTAPIDVWRALSALSQKLREVIVLRYFEDLTSPEIASVLSIPEGTVRFRLMIARQRLRPLLGDYSERFSHAPGEARTNAI